MKSKKVILSLFVISIAIILASVGTKAYFSDTEVCENNTFTIKALDINISHTFHFDNVPPGLSKKESIYIYNDPKSIEANDVYLEIDVTDIEISDDTDAEREAEILLGITNEAGTNRGKTNISKWIQITKMRYNDVSIVNLYTDYNENDYIDLDDLNQAGQVKINGNNKLSPGEVAYVNFTMLFDPDAENELQGDRSVVDEIITAV
ncbi:hypothetical protein MSHOH_1885 [Methanosarcina horonobensis HB-1 = JCM 15518]|uniref:Camelysin metallo-endopeptidase n=1 Tax=Methanosarcina horonobensis HB-1 = JCM 15518 TaxID=1434110 RepID=A0A0E3SFS0_9EURY|nr:TasA family protein [Methanosarcina horonobensis]AKB78368.1 hypothetical protein MSHOH_1885 [Methanosarcina horonobensis HB-1 = JCM 15518]